MKSVYIHTELVLT